MNTTNIDLISVIVPVYNVENYLRQCIESLINQTYKNIEIILIDDGSTDKSGEICEAYKNKDSRIIVFHTKNRGLSCARNLGLDHARGSYISFVDSDDYVDVNFIYKLYSKLVESKSDICACSVNYVKDDVIKSLLKFKNRKYKSNAFFSKTLQVACWFKLYKREIFNELRFPPNKYAEDTFIYYEIISLANYIVTISDHLYFYNVRTNSITNKEKLFFIDEFESRVNVFVDLCKNNSKKAAINIWYLHICFIYNKYSSYPLERNEINSFSNIYIEFIRYRYKVSPLIRLFSKFPNFYSRVKKLIKALSRN